MADLDPLGSLAEPHRRALYDHVVEHGDWVSRDQAADAVGLERGTAAHHLDRLAADGLLDVDYRRLSGRRGPGAGRPAKVYRRSAREFAVSLPPRDYGLAGRLLAEAADRSRMEGIDVVEALAHAARAEGHRLAAASPRGARGRKKSKAAVLQVLSDRGFEPEQADDGTVLLRNCPFHELAQSHRELICGMNLCLLDSAVAHTGSAGLTARLDPADGYCCVKLVPED
jgi:predicted ArsR family transcriptional regulator